MKPAISQFSMALSALLALSSLCLAQNVSINLQPINPPIQIPAPGGSFNYNVTVHNTGASPQTFDAWIMVQLPSGSWYGPVLEPVNLTLPAGASISRQRTQPVPESAPTGTYVYQGRVGIYPSTVWNTSSFTFAKTLEGSQLWVARYNGPANAPDMASSVASDSVGNVYVAGGIDDNDLGVIKYNPWGQQLWVARYNGPANQNDYARALAVDREGNAYATGFRDETYYSGDYVTVKFDPNGNQVWAAGYNGWQNGTDVATAIAVGKSGNVYVTGFLNLYGSPDCATIKYDKDGIQRWAAVYNGPANGGDLAYDIALDSAENVYVTGCTQSPSLDAEYLTLKYDSSGGQLWAVTYHGPNSIYSAAYANAVDAAGNAYVTGLSDFHYATVKYDPSGNQLWVTTYNGMGGEDWAHDIALDRSGNVFVTGFGNEPGYSGQINDYETIKYDSQGHQLWAVRYDSPGGETVDEAYALAVDNFGNCYVTGVSDMFGANAGDYGTIKYDCSGHQIWVALYNGPGGYPEEEASAITVDPYGNAFVTGYSWATGTYRDWCTIKYSGGNPSGAGSNWQPVEALVFGAQAAVAEYRLNPCYPNPFNAETVASFELRVASHVSLRVYDTAGRLVTTLVDGWREAGTHELTFDAGDLPSGVYFCKLQAGDYDAVQKLILLK